MVTTVSMSPPAKVWPNRVKGTVGTVTVKALTMPHALRSDLLLNSLFFLPFKLPWRHLISLGFLSPFSKPLNLSSEGFKHLQ